MELRPEAFLAAIQRQALPSICLIAGAEALIVQECADALRARARAEGYAERELFDIDAGFDWNRLAQALASPSLFAARRLFDLRLPTTRPGKEGSEFLRDCCAHPPPDVLLLITGQEWSGKHAGAWTEAIARAGQLVPVWPLKQDELPGWLAARLRRKGLVATPEALERLVERVEGHLLAAAQEIDKLALLLEPGAPAIDLDTLERLVAESSRYDVFKLVDATLEGDAARLSRILAGLRAEGEAVAGLLGWITMEFVKLAGFAAIQAAGGNLAVELRTARVWEARAVLYRRALQRHPASRWQQFAIALGGVERIAKGRADGDAWRALERLLLAVARPSARSLLPSH